MSIILYTKFMKKFLVTLILAIIIIIFFSKNIFSHMIISNLSKWTKREIIIDKIDINYFKSEIILNSVKVRNLNESYHHNTFEVDKITIQYDLESFFSDLVIFNNLTFINSKIFLEFNTDNKINNNVTNDTNIREIKKLKEKIESKKNDSEKKKKNFLILETKLNNTQTFLKFSDRPKETKIKSSDLIFNRIGNEKNSQNYKSIFKFIITDLFLSIPDQSIKDIIKKAYKL